MLVAMSHQPPEPPSFPPGPPLGGKDPTPPAARRTSENSSPTPPLRRESALKRTVVRPVCPAPDPVDAAFVTNRLTSLTHELANLLEGSLRLVSLARRSVDRADKGNGASGGETNEARTTDEGVLPELGRRLETLQAAMAQMAELVRASMMGMSGVITGMRLPFGASSSLSDAVTHAVEVMRPLADERCIRLDVDLAPDLDEFNAGPIYTVIVNAVRNSIESIERRGTPTGGAVSVKGRIETGRTGRAVVLEVTDDGIGPPRTATHGHENVFRPGFTTKPGGSGIGLAMSLDVVHQLGGTIELLARADGNAGRGRDGNSVGGAMLRVRYPAPERPDSGSSVKTLPETR